MIDLHLPNHPAFKSGFESRKRGLKSETNPYLKETIYHRLWIRGYLHAMETERVSNDETKNV